MRLACGSYWNHTKRKRSLKELKELNSRSTNSRLIPVFAHRDKAVHRKVKLRDILN